MDAEIGIIGGSGFYQFLDNATTVLPSTPFGAPSAPITIGESVWVAAGAFVAPGVTIGAGAVIGARSVVTKDMPDWTVCAGNPCRPLKPRVLRDSPGAPDMTARPQALQP